MNDEKLLAAATKKKSNHAHFYPLSCTNLPMLTGTKERAKSAVKRQYTSHPQNKPSCKNGDNPLPTIDLRANQFCLAPYSIQTLTKLHPQSHDCKITTF